MRSRRPGRTRGIRQVRSLHRRHTKCRHSVSPYRRTSVDSAWTRCLNTRHSNMAMGTGTHRHAADQHLRITTACPLQRRKGHPEIISGHRAWRRRTSPLEGQGRDNPCCRTSAWARLSSKAGVRTLHANHRMTSCGSSSSLRAHREPTGGSGGGVLEPSLPRHPVSVQFGSSQTRSHALRCHLSIDLLNV